MDSERHGLSTCTLRVIQHWSKKEERHLHSVRILLVKCLFYAYSKSSKRQKKPRGNVIFGGHPLFSPTATPRFREVWRKWRNVGNWQNMCAIETCPLFFSYNFATKLDNRNPAVSIWLTILETPVGV